MSAAKMLARQIKAARSLLGWSLEETAAISGVSVPTIAKLESADIEFGGLVTPCATIVHALEAAGVEFLHQGGAGVRLTPAGGYLFEPQGPATEVIAKMDTAIEEDRSGRDRRPVRAGISAKDR